MRLFESIIFVALVSAVISIDTYWSRKFDFNGKYASLQPLEAKNGDLIFFGSTYYFNRFCVNDALFMRLSPVGDLKTVVGYGGKNNTNFKDDGSTNFDQVKEFSDGSFVAIQESRHVIQSDRTDTIVHHISATGEHLWSKLFFDDVDKMDMRPSGFLEDEDGNIIVMNDAAYNAHVNIVLTLNINNGSLMDVKRSNIFDWPRSLLKTNDSYYIGSAYNNFGSTFCNFIRYDHSFNLVYSKRMDIPINCLPIPGGMIEARNGDIIFSTFYQAKVVVSRIDPIPSVLNITWSVELDLPMTISSFTLVRELQEMEDGRIFFHYKHEERREYNDFFVFLNGTNGKVIETFRFKDQYDLGSSVLFLNHNNSWSPSSSKDHSKQIFEQEVLQIYMNKNDIAPVISRLSLVNNKFKCDDVYLNESMEISSEFDSINYPSFVFSGDYGYSLSNSHDIGIVDITSIFGLKELDFDPSHFSEDNFVCNIHKIFCHGVTKTNTSFVCSGHGACISENNCTCFTDYYPNKGTSEDCSRFKCFGKLYNSMEVCNFQNGTCDSVNHCDCKNDYFGTECELWRCNGVLYNISSSVCLGHGNCLAPETCQCEEHYNLTKYCGWKCFEGDHDHELTCSGNGKCISYNNCSCDNGYFGEKCEGWYCHGYKMTDTTNVCGGHGVCEKKDSCKCTRGYSSSGDICDEFFCENYYKNDDDVCNGRGKCIGNQKCECDDGFYGQYCGNFDCFSIEKSDKEKVCSNGKGKCVSPNTCNCKDGYTGDDCSNNLYLSTVMAPILSLTIVTFVVCLICISIFVVLCLFCFACLIVFLFLNVSIAFVFQNFKQRVGLQRFSKLRNFDLLLKEQELDEDMSIAHLKIDKSLFEISFEEIILERVLGQGGSNSTVYKAVWKGSNVAFKVFRTRDILENQNSFDEFEREVKILGSVSHPSILRFFGCSLKPPRVGIVMEYCENGDLLFFLQNYGNLKNVKNNSEHDDDHQQSEKNEIIRCPFPEKMRLMEEVIIGMDYLHSRNIIHRDLKCENVLVSSEEHCKLMDFGLSKIIDRMSQQKTQRIGTNIYMAPELVIGDFKYDEKVDVFSFSIMMYLIITEKFTTLYGEKMSDNVGVEFRVASDPSLRPKLVQLMKDLSDYSRKYGCDYFWLKDVIVKCWDNDAFKRLSFKELSDIFKRLREMSRTKKRLDVEDDDEIKTGMERKELEAFFDDDDDVRKRGKIESEKKRGGSEVERDLRRENEELKRRLEKLEKEKD